MWSKAPHIHSIIDILMLNYSGAESTPTAPGMRQVFNFKAVIEIWRRLSRHSPVFCPEAGQALRGSSPDVFLGNGISFFYMPIKPPKDL